MTHTTGIKTPLETWRIEITGARKTISQLSLIPGNKLLGFRAPYLRYNENSFRVLSEENFLYDSSVIEVPGYLSKNQSSFIWPYTLDYGIAQKCWTGKCPKERYPGLFEIPIWILNPNKKTWEGAMNPDAGSREELFDLLKKQFLLRYNGNRTPFGLFLHSFWLEKSEDHVNALKDFLAWASEFPDVWFISETQLIRFMQKPASSQDLAREKYMACESPASGQEICDGWDNNGDGKIDEDLVHKCSYNEGSFNTCAECPPIWPTGRYANGEEIRPLSSR